MSTEDQGAAVKAAESDELKTPPAEEPAPSAAEAAASQEQDEAAKLWAEFPDHGGEKQPEKTGGEKISNEFTESQAEPDKDAAVGEQEQADAAPKGDKQAAPPPADDIWAKASPELRAAHEAEMAALRKTANDAKAHAGRMRKQFEGLKASADRAADQPGSKLGDTLDKGLADYPEIAQPVKDALSPIEKRLEALDRIEADQRTAQTDEVNRHIQSQQELLEAAHPGWEAEYIQGPLAKQFYDWIKSPDRPVKFVKTVFETNADHIFDASAAIEVFDAFKADTAGTGPTPGNGQNQELSAKRAAQLDGSRSPKTPGGPARVSGIPREGDPQSIWKAFPDDNADDRLRRRV
ncbi:hypothetical protein [Mesorhizobium sp. B2-1-2]|uniref:hypothetical protein n=1 Tax=Mesorhizobium sp. B2-1-2 TaxID=2589973 RepID=UPI0011293211|nr:hypothetical protein [Mesorhizobium sp. B2-1-2]TPN11720.1 hypothetical protein FJ971_09950 [Mesorhizobium sp. B2-1-2]